MIDGCLILFGSILAFSLTTDMDDTRYLLLIRESYYVQSPRPLYHLPNGRGHGVAGVIRFHSQDEIGMLGLVMEWSG